MTPQKFITSQKRTAGDMVAGLSKADTAMEKINDLTREIQYRKDFGNVLALTDTNERLEMKLSMAKREFARAMTEYFDAMKDACAIAVDYNAASYLNPQTVTA